MRVFLYFEWSWMIFRLFWRVSSILFLNRYLSFSYILCLLHSDHKYFHFCLLSLLFSLFSSLFYFLFERYVWRILWMSSFYCFRNRLKKLNIWYNSTKTMTFRLLLMRNCWTQVMLWTISLFSRSVRSKRMFEDIVRSFN